MLASRFLFKRLIGVEFALALVETARRNFKRFGCTAEVVHADAAYRFPHDDLQEFAHEIYQLAGAKVYHFD